MLHPTSMLVEYIFILVQFVVVPAVNMQFAIMVHHVVDFLMCVHACAVCTSFVGVLCNICNSEAVWSVHEGLFFSAALVSFVLL